MFPSVFYSAASGERFRVIMALLFINLLSSSMIIWRESHKRNSSLFLYPLGWWYMCNHVKCAHESC